MSMLTLFESRYSLKGQHEKFSLLHCIRENCENTFKVFTCALTRVSFLSNVHKNINNINKDLFLLYLIPHYLHLMMTYTCLCRPILSPSFPTNNKNHMNIVLKLLIFFLSLSPSLLFLPPMCHIVAVSPSQPLPSTRVA